MRAVVLFLLVLALGNALTGEMHVAALFIVVAALALMVRWAVLEVSAKRQRPAPDAAPAQDPRTRTIRDIRLWLRSLGRDDSELSDSDIEAFARCMIAFSRHGRLTKRALGDGRIRITLEMVESPG